MSAGDVMREAAAQMRANAEQATHGPWYASPDGVIVGSSKNPDIAQEVPSWNQAHIACWTPEAACAVADLLDYEADMQDMFDKIYQDHPEHIAMAAPNEYIMKLARSYLRRVDE
jgi:hypothetical protein